MSNASISFSVPAYQYARFRAACEEYAYEDKTRKGEPLDAIEQLARFEWLARILPERER